ncbi:MAG: phosphonate C-P lyase system protein PhnG [Rhodospirillales bacterium]|nr:phosphonate C-P lyase system protein PhnG [Rhodospirillales bacterium]
MSADPTPRQRWIAILARAGAEAIAARLPPAPPHRRLRGPETGLLMLRGRAGGTGAPFNLGEVTVTRCTLRLDDGTIGHATILGRDARHAELAALADALLQDRDAGAALHDRLIAPLEAAQASAAETIAAHAAATRVEFFAMRNMRG